MIQIIAMIILATSGDTFTARLPKPVFPDMATCQAYLESEAFKADFATLTEQVTRVHQEKFTFKISCEPGNSI